MATVQEGVSNLVMFLSFISIIGPHSSPQFMKSNCLAFNYSFQCVTAWRAGEKQSLLSMPSSDGNRCSPLFRLILTFFPRSGTQRRLPAPSQQSFWPSGTQVCAVEPISIAFDLLCHFAHQIQVFWRCWQPSDCFLPSQTSLDQRWESSDCVTTSFGSIFGLFGYLDNFIRWNP